MRLFVDTSLWYALLNEADRNHATAKRVLGAAKRLTTSNLVFAESVALVRGRLGHGVAVRLGDYLRAAPIDLVHVSPADEDEAWKLFRARKDKSYSFTDCASFVLMRGLGIKQAATLDDDFRQEGFTTRP